jgi:hypothetical protein
MANRNFFRKQSMEREVKELHAEVSIGASGAPTLTRRLGIASVVRNSAGNYTITLEDKYNALLALHVMKQLAAGAPSSVDAVIRSEDVDGAKTIVLEFLDTAGAPVEVDSGTVLKVKMDLKNTSVVR